MYSCTVYERQHHLVVEYETGTNLIPDNLHLYIGFLGFVKVGLLGLNESKLFSIMAYVFPDQVEKFFF